MGPPLCRRLPTVARAALLTAAAAVASPRAARAQEGVAPPTLVWRAPPGCPAAADVEARVARRLDRPAAAPEGGPAVVDVERVPNGYLARVTMGAGSRSLTAPTCDDAAEAVAVVVALARGGRAEPSAPLPEPGAEAIPAAPAPPEPSARRPEAPPPSDPARDAWGARLALGIALDAASLPRPSPGLSLQASVHRGALGFGLAASGFLPTSARFSRPTGARGVAEVGLVDVLALACATPRLAGPDEAGRAGRIEAGACGGAGAGVLFGASDGVAAPEKGAGVRPELAALARLGVGLGAGLALRAEAGLVIDPVRFPFRVANVGDVFRPPAAAARASVGLELVLF